MIKATIEMNDHTLLEHKFKSEIELERWKRIHSADVIKVKAETISKAEYKKYGITEDEVPNIEEE